MDRIEIVGLRAHGRHGVLAEEQQHGQMFVLDVVAEVDLEAARRSDALADTIDYAALVTRLSAAVSATRFDLIEALAGHLCDLVLADARVAAVEVRVAKPEAPIALPLSEVAVRLRRERPRL